MDQGNALIDAIATLVPEPVETEFAASALRGLTGDRPCVDNVPVNVQMRQ